MLRKPIANNLPPLPSEQINAKHQRSLSHQRSRSRSSEAPPQGAADYGCSPSRQVYQPQHVRHHSQCSSPIVPSNPISMVYGPPAMNYAQMYNDPYTRMYDYGPPSPHHYGGMQRQGEPMDSSCYQQMADHNERSSTQFSQSTGGGPQYNSNVVIYHAPRRDFLGRTGALEFLCLMTEMPYELRLVNESNKAMIRALKLSSGGLLAMNLPILQQGGRAYIQCNAAARVLAKQNGLYGHDTSADYYADAVMDSLQPWLGFQPIVMMLGSEGGEIPPNIASMNPNIHHYLAERPLFYKLLETMLESWPHLLRPQSLNASWIDPLILAGLVDDMILDKKLSKAPDFSNYKTTMELIEGSYGCLFFNALVNELFASTIGARVETALSLAQPIAFRDAKTIAPSQDISAATSAGD